MMILLPGPLVCAPANSQLRGLQIHICGGNMLPKQLTLNELRLIHSKTMGPKKQAAAQPKSGMCTFLEPGH
jgi:hypothetical protein